MKKDYLQTSDAGSEREFVAEFWDRLWRDESENAARRAALRRGEEFAFVAPALRGGRPLDALDCGCGTGDFTLLLRELGLRARGIDIAPQTIARLRERFGELFELGDFRATPFADASFDLITNWGGIEHFEEGPLLAIREAFRLLRPGGSFVASTPCHNTRLFLMDAWRGQSGGPGFPESEWRFYQYRFTRAELEAYFRGCGFVEVRSRTINATQGLERAFQHELFPLRGLFPAPVRGVIARLAGPLLRPLLGHMVICRGVRP